MAAVKMIHKIARLAERADHHPDLHLTRYKKLRVVLTTHDVSHVTMKDFKLAGEMLKSFLLHTVVCGGIHVLWCHELPIC